MVVWFADIGADDVPTAGGKAASLGELVAAGFNVPDGFVVAAETYRDAIEKAGIADDLREAVDIDVEESAELREAAEEASTLIESMEFPESVREDILAAYERLGGDEKVSVAVRSSATAEDLPSIAADEPVLLRVDGEPVFGPVAELAPLDCDRHDVEVPSLTDDGVAWKEVECLYEHPTEDEELVRITTSTGRQITIAPDHSLVVLDEDTLEPKTISVDELEGDEKVPVIRDLAPIDSGSETIDVTDYIRGNDVIRSDGGVIIDNNSMNASIQQTLPETIEADEDFAYFMGLYVAEGSTYGVHTISITNVVDEILARGLIWPERVGLWNGQAKNKHSYRFHCKSLVRFLHAVAGAPADFQGKGRLSQNKRVPEFVFGWDQERIGHFLRGCFDGDGTVGKTIEYTTTSEALANGISRLLELVGIDYNIRERERKDGWSDTYRINVPAREAGMFRERIGFESPHKSKRLDELIDRHDEKSYYPEFGRTIAVSDELSDLIRNRFEETLPKREVTIVRCSDCGDEINKSSSYAGLDRWYCPECSSTYYEEDVLISTEYRYCQRDEKVRFKAEEIPWNKARLSGRYSQRHFTELVSTLGIPTLGFDESVGWDDINRIETVPYNGPVYDFCVPGSETFAAGRGSVITHNTASFAGQQETYLNVTEKDLLDRIKACWASLYTQRAIYYRARQGFAAEDVDIAVVVQRMIDAEKSGVMFTAHPSTDEDILIIEAAWGLGEAVVSGTVTPDQYELDRTTGEVRDRTIATKTRQVIRDPETGETVETDVPPDKRDATVLSPAELGELYELGDEIAAHYGNPQDVEWAIEGGEVYLLQSRPITTKGENGEPTDEAQPDGLDEPLISGLGASPGTVTGPATLVTRLDHLDQVEEGDVLVTEMTTPDMVPAMQRAVAIVTDEGGMTSHAAIVSRELGVPAVTGTGNATSVIEDGQWIRVDGEKGTVTAAAEETTDDEAAPAPTQRAEGGGKPMTATEVKVNVSIPDAAERAAATGADGVGLLRLEHLVLTLGKTPERYIEDAGERAYQDRLVAGIRTVADAFYPRQVRVRTIDAPTDEFRELTGGEDEPKEHNPMMGYRAIRRSLDKPDVFRQELEAIARLQQMGYDNLEVMFPLVTDAADVIAAKEQMVAAGIDPDRRRWGVMIETPASALCITEIIETGIDFVSFGTNDLTQYTLAVDRNNAAVAGRFDEMHPAVLSLLEETIATCRESHVSTSVCGEAASRPEMVRFLVKAGVTSVSPNIDAVVAVQETVKREEQRLLLESVR